MATRRSFFGWLLGAVAAAPALPAIAEAAAAEVAKPAVPVVRGRFLTLSDWANLPIERNELIDEMPLMQADDRALTLRTRLPGGLYLL